MLTRPAVVGVIGCPRGCVCRGARPWRRAAAGPVDGVQGGLPNAAPAALLRCLAQSLLLPPPDMCVPAWPPLSRA